MKSTVSVMALMILTFTVSAGSLTFSNSNKAKHEYKHNKCIDGVSTVSALKAKLTLSEICKYGKNGCSSMNSQSKVSAYCEHDTLSKCFESKSWQTIDQILNVELQKAPGLITYGLKTGSEHEGKTCAFWD